MNAREQGFLLLTSSLGDPERKPLTVAQFRQLTLRARAMQRPTEDRDMTAGDLVQIGYDRESADRIIGLLSQKDLLQRYVQRGVQRDCFPVTRVSFHYPAALRSRLGLDCPGVLWAKGNLSLLEKPAIALVGSRDLRPENAAFAREAGMQAAAQGYVLVSGNARGADRIAQDSCLEHGGAVISVVADPLERCPRQHNVLYLAEDGYDIAFSSYRALHRNRVIHCLGQKTLVAQSSLRGGTWDGTTKNLQNNWSSVFCYDDRSAAAEALLQMGAAPVTIHALSNLAALKNDFLNFIDQ